MSHRALGLALCFIAIDTGIGMSTEPNSQWAFWLRTGHLLLDIEQKGLDFAEAVVRAAYGDEEVAEERPFVAEDLGTDWRVRGTRTGTHAIPYFAVSSAIVLDKQTGAIRD